MNETIFLMIYLRKTNGLGQKISVNSLITTKQLYGFAAQVLKLGEKKFQLFLKGMKINQDSEVTLQKLKIQQQQIIHVRQKDYNQNEKILLRVFCKGSIYSYETTKQSTIYTLKQQMVTILGCNFNDIVISHLGKVISNYQTFQYNQIKNRDLISVIIHSSNIYQKSSTRLKPKMAESLTFAATDEIDSTYQPFAKEVMRKSSMKSSHQSRQFKMEESKKLLHVIRPKSQKGNNLQAMDQQNLNLLKIPWLSNQRMIQTQSINFDDPQIQEEPQYWAQCKVELINSSDTISCTIQCYQFCDIHALQGILARIQRRKSQDIILTFPDQNLQKMAQSGQSILSIAKFNKTKIIHNVVFN